MSEDNPNVHHPSHHGGDTIYETIKVLEARLTPEQFIGFCRGNSIKYMLRAGQKTTTVEGINEDIGKAIVYQNFEIDFRNRLESGNVGEVKAKNIAIDSYLEEKINDYNQS